MNFQTGLLVFLLGLLIAAPILRVRIARFRARGAQAPDAVLALHVVCVALLLGTLIALLLGHFLGHAILW